MNWRMKWHPTPVFLTGESQGWGSLVGFHLWGLTELDSTEVTTAAAPWKKSYDQPIEHVKKQRHCFANKGPFVKAMVFLVVMYGCESWTIKKAEHQRIYAFELWCWRRLLRVPWTAGRSNQSILKEIRNIHWKD